MVHATSHVSVGRAHSNADGRGWFFFCRKKYRPFPLSLPYSPGCAMTELIPPGEGVKNPFCKRWLLGKKKSELFRAIWRDDGIAIIEVL